MRNDCITDITIRDICTSWIYSDVTLYPECTVGELFEAVNTALNRPGLLVPGHCALLLSDRKTLVRSGSALLGDYNIKSGDTLYICPCW